AGGLRRVRGSARAQASAKVQPVGPYVLGGPDLWPLPLLSSVPAPHDLSRALGLGGLPVDVRPRRGKPADLPAPGDGVPLRAAGNDTSRSSAGSAGTVAAVSSWRSTRSSSA